MVFQINETVGVRCWSIGIIAANSSSTVICARKQSKMSTITYWPQRSEETWGHPSIGRGEGVRDEKIQDSDLKEHYQRDKRDILAVPFARLGRAETWYCGTDGGTASSTHDGSALSAHLFCVIFERPLGRKIVHGLSIIGQNIIVPIYHGHFIEPTQRTKISSV